MVDVEGAFNFRDLGGLTAADGRQLVRGRIFRSATLDGLTDQGLATVASLGIRTVIDLRSEAEVERHGRFPHERTGARWIHVPAGMAPPQSDEDDRYRLMAEHPDPLRMVILAMVTETPEVLAKIIALLAEAEAPPLVFHCTSGKDRTGLLAALVQLAVGVDLEAVLVDFEFSTEAIARSDINLTDRYPVMQQLTPERLARFDTADRTWILGALDALGGVDRLIPWFESIGVDAATRAGLERNLLDR